MRHYFAIGLGTAMALAQSSPSNVHLDPEALGRMEGILAFCAKLDPQAAEQYRERSRQLVRDETDAALDGMRKSKQYQDAFESINGQLAAVPADEGATKSCRAFLTLSDKRQLSQNAGQ